jgi:hypothetical protein
MSRGTLQRARTVGLAHVDGETHVDVRVADEARLAVGRLGVAVVHVGHRVGDGPHDGVADDVREAELALTAAVAVAVDDLAVDLEQLGGHVAEAGGGGHRQAAFHVGGNREAGTTDGLADIVGDHGRAGRGGQHRCRCGRGRSGRVGRSRSDPSGHILARAVRRPVCRAVGGAVRSRRLTTTEGDRRAAAVVGEELTPGLGHRVGIGQELGVHLIDEPGVRAEVGARVIDRSHRI